MLFHSANSLLILPPHHLVPDMRNKFNIWLVLVRNSMFTSCFTSYLLLFLHTCFSFCVSFHTWAKPKKKSWSLVRLTAGSLFSSPFFFTHDLYACQTNISKSVQFNWNICISLENKLSSDFYPSPEGGASGTTESSTKK